LIARVRRVPLRVSLTLSDRAPEGELVLHEAEFKEALSELLVVRNLAGGAPMVIHTLGNARARCGRSIDSSSVAHAQRRRRQFRHQPGVPL
jgi:hypothetical protein